jgi:hypothetical protein
MHQMNYWGVIMDKRYQVFVSSTFEDLQEERKEVIQVLLEMECMPAGMELFPASDDDQWTLIKQIIDDSDYYVLILAGRYGSIGPDGVGYTEMEYRYAMETGKPIISFLHKDPENIPAKKSEQSEEGKAKLKDFRTLVQSKMTKYWTNANDLGSVVSRSMNRLTKSSPAIGWVRSDNVSDERSTKEILRLKMENEGLKQQIEESKTQAPKGTGDLSQGDDYVNISFLARWCDKEYNTYVDTIKCQATWNALFAYISPHLLDELKESEFKELFAVYLKGLLEKELIKITKYKEFEEFASFSIVDTDFQKIKVQVKALGLIKQSEKNKSVKDKCNYWTLTEYGDYIMTQLIAIKR